MLKTLKQMKNSIKTGSRMKEATILRLKKNTIIHDAFDVLMDSFEDTGKFDFSAVDSLSDELKSSDSYKQEAADVVNLCCEALVKLHQKCCISIRFVMQTIHNLQRFADIVPSIRGLDRHYDAFFPVDNADCSFLTDFDSIAEGLEAAKNDSDNYLAMVGSNSPLSRLAALKDILKSEDYVAAVSNLLFADQEVAPYAGMKKNDSLSLWRKQTKLPLFFWIHIVRLL